MHKLERDYKLFPTCTSRYLSYNKIHTHDWPKSRSLFSEGGLLSGEDSKCPLERRKSSEVSELQRPRRPTVRLKKLCGTSTRVESLLASAIHTDTFNPPSQTAVQRCTEGQRNAKPCCTKCTTPVRTARGARVKHFLFFICKADLVSAQQIC